MCQGFGFVETYEALKVALHCGGATLAAMGILSAANYLVATMTGADYRGNGGYICCDRPGPGNVLGEERSAALRC